MNKRPAVSTPQKHLALLVVMVICTIFIFGCLTHPSTSTLFNSEQVRHLSDGWSYLDGNGVAHPVTLPVRGLPVAPEQTLTVSTTLPDDLSDPVVICYRSSQQSTRVILGDTEIYSYGLPGDPDFFSQAPGSTWNLVRLPNGCQGETLTIELNSPYSLYSGQMSNVFVGSKASIVFHLLQTYGPRLAITCVIMLAGMVMVGIYLILCRSGIDKNTLYMGLFSILMAVWMFSESRLTQLITGNSFLILGCSFIAIITVPIPFFKYICCIKDFRYKKLPEAFIVSFYFVLAVSLLLQMSKMLDIIEMLPFIHIFLCTSVGAVFLSLAFDLFINHNRNLRSIFYTTAILGAFCIAEIAMVYLNGHSGVLMQLGVLAFISIHTVAAIRNAAKLMMLSRVATIDTLTGCQNRTSYIQHIRELAVDNDVMVVMADINNLKMINDNFGHNYGDEAIVRTGQCFLNTFGDFGDCFRIGGDEFVFIGCGISPSQCSNLISDFESACETAGRDLSFPFTVAYGCVFFDRECDRSITDTVCRADKLMYEHKHSTKSDSMDAKIC